MSRTLLQDAHLFPTIYKESEEEPMQVIYPRCAGLDVHQILPNAPSGLSRKNACYSE